LGGSVALAARAGGVAREIVGVGRDRRRLEGPLRAGVVDRIATDVEAGVDGADCVVLAATVLANERLLESIWGRVPAGALVTDVGSTKRGIVAVAERLGSGRPLAFLGSHPMAGSEKSGWLVACRRRRALRARRSRVRRARLPGHHADRRLRSPDVARRPARQRRRGAREPRRLPRGARRARAPPRGRRRRGYRGAAGAVEGDAGGARVNFRVRPVRRLAGECEVPGDKSISHRAALLGALADGLTEVQGYLEAEDCLRTLTAIQMMGVE